MESCGKLDVTAIVTAHREGRLAHRTMRSVWRAVEAARERGVSVEIVATLDRADDATIDYFASHQPEVRIHRVDFGDVGLARNRGVELAKGRYVAFLDGDDLFCRDWLWRAYAAAEAAGTPGVWHPLHTIEFGRDVSVLQHSSSTDPGFRPEDLAETCQWTSATFSPRELCLRFPLQATLPSSGFGSEVWRWHCDLLAADIPIRTVPETAFFSRRRLGSRSSDQIASEAVRRPSPLFDWPILRDKATETNAEAWIAESPAPPTESSEVQVDASAPGSGTATRWLKFALRTAGRMVAPRRLRRATREFLVALTEPLPKEQEPKDNAPAERNALPDWLAAEWRAIHAIEPLLYPKASTKIDVLRARPRSALGSAYVDLCRRVPNSISHVFVVPWLVRGGADLETIQYVRVLIEEGLADGVAVVATESRDSTWAARLPTGAAFVEFGKLYGRRLDEDQRRRLLVQWLLQKRPRVVHVMNSHLGHEAFARHGAALASASRLFAHVFCDAIDGEGKWYGYNRFYLPDSYDHLTAILGDNQTELDELAKTFAFDPKKLLVHYQPMSVSRSPRTAPRRQGGQPLEVLWAGRLDDQKRPDILAAIVRKCEGRPIRFHVYGSPVICQGKWKAPEGPNVVAYGAFEGFESLPIERFGAFLYTSQYDGLPNVLLEAAAAGLPIVASDVGGVKEVIRAGETGYPIAPFDDVDRYVAALTEIASEGKEVERFVRNGWELLARRHSREAFVEAILRTPGYVAAERKAASRAA